MDEILGAEYYSELKRMSKNNGTVLTGLNCRESGLHGSASCISGILLSGILETDGEEGIEKWLRRSADIT